MYIPPSNEDQTRNVFMLITLRYNFRAHDKGLFTK